MSHIRDIESKMGSLERENFELKMKIFYLNQQLNEKSDIPGQVVNDSSNTDVNVLVAENDLLIRRVRELEYEMAPQHSTEQKPSHGRGNGNKSHASSSSIHTMSNQHFEENRKQGRQAALLIAESDAQLIEEMSASMESLKRQHEKDVLELNFCKEKLSSIIEEKSELAHLLSLEKKKVVYLQARCPPGGSAYSAAREDEVDGDPTPPPQPPLPPSRVAGSSSQSNSRKQMRDDFLLSITSQVDSSELLLLEGGGLGFGTSIPQVNPHSNRAKAQVAAAWETREPQEFMDFGANTAWEELHRLRNENDALKLALKQEKVILLSQEEALKKVQKSAEEITLLEAEEIVRLESELDRCLDESEKWQQQSHHHEERVRLLEQRLANLEGKTSGSRDDGTMAQGKRSSDVLDVDDWDKEDEDEDDGDGDGGVEEVSLLARSIGGPREHDGNVSHLLSEDVEVAFNASASVVLLQRKLDSYSSGREAPSKGAKSLNFVELQKTVEIYRQREAELLQTLEGLVLRCQELESRL